MLRAGHEPEPRVETVELLTGKAGKVLREGRNMTKFAKDTNRKYIIKRDQKGRK